MDAWCLHYYAFVIIIQLPLEDQLKQQSKEQHNNNQSEDQLEQTFRATEWETGKKVGQGTKSIKAMLQEQAIKTEGHIRPQNREIASIKETIQELLKKLLSKWTLYTCLELYLIIDYIIMSYFNYWLQIWVQNDSLLLFNLLFLYVSLLTVVA